MFFVRGLTSHHKEVLINPEQVQYVCRLGRKKAAVILTHRKRRLIVDQDPPMVERRFEEFLKGFVDAH
ncbi:MAG: hypothetical protein Q7S58_12965 [Candidatus Binatus sp.]|uniref:hypothetical protein n=1 Tax=Candidatus Binatus sp. TaxID=2811406 RepID=UPI00271822F4|nr:hypothetical protein [Candidatus Binatus sp.]MDO8433311.1 hypothetical protein [Candidatus Binatus sp.]